MNNNEQKLIDLIIAMESTEAIKLSAEMLAAGTGPLAILELCRSAMDIVGKKFEDGEFFVPELILAGDTLEQISALVKPLLAKAGEEGRQKHGKVLIGTVAGDLHDIGKNIVTFMLDVNGFEVKDIGIDVPIEAFLDAIREFQPQVVALSGFLTLAFDAMQETVAAIEAAGQRDPIKIMIGGGQVDETVRDYTGADAFGMNAMDAVRQCKEWLEVAD